MWRGYNLALRKMPRVWTTIQMSKVRLHGAVGGEVLIAKVMVSLKLYPSDVVGDMSGLKKTVEKTLEGKASIYKFEEEPVAFGLVALIAHVLVPEEKSGLMDEVENQLKNTPGISEVQVLVSRRIA